MLCSTGIITVKMEDVIIFISISQDVTSLTSAGRIAQFANTRDIRAVSSEW